MELNISLHFNSTKLFVAYSVKFGTGIALIAASNSSLVANPLTSGIMIPKIASFNS
jgi:hypothetical protein